MSNTLVPPVAEGKTWVPHIPGAFAAVCADAYVQEFDNKWYGKPKAGGKGVNTDKKVTKACLAFLTTHIEEFNGLPQNAKQLAWFKFGWGSEEYPSALYEFIKSWYPTATREQIIKMDLRKLVGKAAYVTITNEADDNGKIWSNIKSIMGLPPGMIAPKIPMDFMTHDMRMELERSQMQTTAAQAQLDAQAAPAPAPTPVQAAVSMVSGAQPVAAPVDPFALPPQNEDDLPF